MNQILAWLEPKHSLSPRLDAPPPLYPNIHSFQVQLATKLCVLELNTPLSYAGPPSATLFPPSTLCFYQGAVRAPLLRPRLKGEHIQWGLSQWLSVSIKNPGNTTLSAELLLKGQSDWVLRNLSASPSHCFQRRRKKQKYTQQINSFMNDMRTLQGLLSRSEKNFLTHTQNTLQTSRSTTVT